MRIVGAFGFRARPRRGAAERPLYATIGRSNALHARGDGSIAPGFCCRALLVSHATHALTVGRFAKRCRQKRRAIVVARAPDADAACGQAGRGVRGTGLAIRTTGNAAPSSRFANLPGVTISVGSALDTLVQGRVAAQERGARAVRVVEASDACARQDVAMKARRAAVLVGRAARKGAALGVVETNLAAAGCDEDPDHRAAKEASGRPHGVSARMASASRRAKPPG